MCKCCSPRTATIIRSIYASVGIVIGLIICAVFSVVFDNRPAAYLGLGSSLFAVVCLVQFLYLHVRVEIQRCKPHLHMLCIFGVLGAIGISLGLGACVTFLGLGIIDSVNHKDLPLPRTHYIACVWAFGIFKWGITAFLYALKAFRKMFRGSFQPLQEQVDEDSLEEEGADGQDTHTNIQHS